MPLRSLALLLVAAIFALGTAYLVRGYIAGSKSALPTGTVNVLVAASDIPQGSFVQAAKHLQWAPWPEKNVG